MLLSIDSICFGGIREEQKHITCIFGDPPWTDRATLGVFSLENT